MEVRETQSWHLGCCGRLACPILSVPAPNLIPDTTQGTQQPCPGRGSPACPTKAPSYLEMEVPVTPRPTPMKLWFVRLAQLPGQLRTRHTRCVGSYKRIQDRDPDLQETTYLPLLEPQVLGLTSSLTAKHMTLVPLPHIPALLSMLPFWLMAPPWPPLCQELLPHPRLILSQSAWPQKAWLRGSLPQISEVLRKNFRGSSEGKTK